MTNAALFLLLPLAFGLLMLIPLLLVRGPARKLIFVLALLIVNLSVLVIIGAVFLVSRLDGAGPPGLGEVLAPVALPLLMTALLDAGLVFVYRKG